MTEGFFLCLKNFSLLLPAACYVTILSLITDVNPCCVDVIFFYRNSYVLDMTLQTNMLKGHKVLAHTIY